MWYAIPVLIYCGSMFDFPKISHTGKPRTLMVSCRGAGAGTCSPRAMALLAGQFEMKRAIRTRHASRTSAYPRAHRVDARLPDRSSFCPDVKMIAR